MPLAVVALGLLSAAPTTHGQRGVILAADCNSEAALLAPTQGRPVFVAPGGTLRVAVQFPESPGVLNFALVVGGRCSERHTLGVLPASAGAGPGFELRVPDDIPARTYDLEVNGGGTVLVGRHAVAVARVGRHVRLVHLSNMNVGEPGVLDFDRRLVAEVNLWAPTLIVATGDFVDTTHTDPRSGWQRLSEYLAGFDAPTLVARGDHDALDLYTRYMAPSPVGIVELGDYRGIVLHDLPAHPITTDPDQVHWIERLLSRSDKDVSFVVAHDECPSLLRHWFYGGTLKQYVCDGKLALWFAGGYRDWNGIEYAESIRAAWPMLYVRTHAASNTTRGGAEGVSHYRVIDIEGGRVVPRGPLTAEGIPASIPVGRLIAKTDGQNDGSRARVEFSAVNTLSVALTDLSARVLVRRVGNARPWCQGARLAGVVGYGEFWECRLSFDLPDRGSIRALVGTGPKPQQPNVTVTFEGPRELALRAVTADDGVSYESGDWPGVIWFENRGDRPAEVTPLPRLDGEPVAYRVIDEPGPVAAAYRLRLAPRQRAGLVLDCSALRVRPGRRTLQVYLRNVPHRAATLWPMEVVRSEGESSSTRR